MTNGHIIITMAAATATAAAAALSWLSVRLFLN